MKSNLELVVNIYFRVLTADKLYTQKSVKRM